MTTTARGWGTQSADQPFKPMRFDRRSLRPDSWNLLKMNRAVGGSAIGVIPETQEMLDFCAANDIYPECEMIRMQEVNDAYERLLRSDVRYRFVIDMASFKAAA